VGLALLLEDLVGEQLKLLFQRLAGFPEECFFFLEGLSGLLQARLETRLLCLVVGNLAGFLLEQAAIESELGGYCLESALEPRHLAGPDFEPFLDQACLGGSLVRILRQSGLEGCPGFLIGVPQPDQARDESADQRGNGQRPVGFDQRGQGQYQFLQGSTNLLGERLGRSV
jgi:hypothetical protein